ncbi:helix-turn-helix transcriptional regulator [Kineosporia babensis]|uniref:Helix-turn-helix transcriptional regulator n=1 Tax=Kineosporia babensis TaxID=499548 RepID=A0A9X1NKC8_9ACTN|nr:helix-turn-helix transcriptional regulator [Kineosporia babensis]MCD5315184.1 helix-turn-helix transcriptional regulator [Kineosporia babensis]
MDRAELADFLRKRREALQPEDVGLPRGQRRRTGGLRREEVAALCGMSENYYSRIEQQRGPQPSAQMLAAIARGLHLSLAERDHLFEVGGHPVPQRQLRGDHITPGMMRIIDRLEDTPAQVLNHLGETLKQTRPAIALMGDDQRWTGKARSLGYRWFTEPEARCIYPPEDHDMHSRIFAAGMRERYGRKLPRVAEYVDDLLAKSPEFVRYWSEHEVGLIYTEGKRYLHPQLGVLDLQCQTLVDPEQHQTLLVYTAAPGTEAYEKLQLLSAVDFSTL